MSALEIDPGGIGDDFGDVYDIHLPAQRVETLGLSHAAVKPILAPPTLLVYRSCSTFRAWLIPAKVVYIWPPPCTIILYLFCRVLRL